MISSVAERFAGGIRQRAKALTSLLLAGLLIAGLSFSAIGTNLDTNLMSLRMDALKRAPSGNVTVVQIDTRSLNAAGDWPWPRERYARALSNLNAAGAGMIVFDVDFSARSTPWGDAALKSAIDENPGWIVLPTFLQRDYKHKNSPFGAIGENALLASVNVELSEDGRVNNYRRGYFFEGVYYPTIGGLLAGVEPGDVRDFQIDFGIDLNQIDTISFDDVLNGTFDPALVQDRNILIGASAIELGDLVSTPHSAAVPGVYIHALGYESLLQNRAIISPPTWVTLGIGLLVLLVGSWMAVTQKLIVTIAAQAAIATAAVSASFFLQALYPVNLSLAPTLFAVAWNVAYAVRQVYRRREREMHQQKSAYLKHMARHDSETGLPNRAALLEDMASACDRNGLQESCIVVFGIDRFREIRGAFGYSNANILVRTLSEVLKERGLVQDVYRLDRSVVASWINADTVEEIEAALQDLEQAGTLPMEIAGQTLNVTMRMGVSYVEAAGACLETDLENAGLALDQARKNARTLVRWEHAGAEDPQLKLAMLNDIFTALEEDEFEIVYQPKFSVREGKFTDLEALIRWNHKRFGRISPDAFIPTAEQTGAIDRLTMWIAIQVIREQEILRSKGVDASIAINVSGSSICDLDFCDRLIALICESGARIAIEITETAVMERPDIAIQGISRFRENGIRLSIDDYGSGQSSLSYLKTLDAQELKIDRSLLENVRDSQRDRLILKSTIDLAHALNMDVVCEGVEDAHTLAALTALGCDKVQGYYLARPMPLTAACDLFLSQDNERAGQTNNVVAI